ncbi:ankyrin repeat domain-containing protein 16-like [Stegodyphus dumicola]|uniref:ankyrin repeat domain-containing protein 16-like n=1 Tax=Stegodyphus dumicola TaxID=202533 RepID=UPI0015AE9DF4|nr:ankyrin repeat domain-containing protein 16-like [Stegodyphus dumicola]
MDFNAFKNHLLEATHTADYPKFLKTIKNYTSFDNSWSEICHKRSGDTILHLAASSGCVEIMKYCKETGLSSILQKTNFDGKTPLHIAAYSGHLPCIKYLLSENVPVDPLKRADWTPLMMACTRSNIDIIKELLQHGANPLLRNKDGWTAFHIACRDSTVDVINCLLDINPSLWSTKSKTGRTPLHTACLHGHLEIVKVLLKRGCYEKDIMDTCGITPLMDSVSGNHHHIVEYLLQENAASFDKTDCFLRTVLHLAAEAGNLNSIQYFVKHKNMHVNCQTLDGLTPLHYAAKEKQGECVKLLLQLGADCTLKDKNERTAAAFGCKEEINAFFGRYLTDTNY